MAPQDDGQGGESFKLTSCVLLNYGDSKIAKETSCVPFRKDPKQVKLSRDWLEQTEEKGQGAMSASQSHFTLSPMQAEKSETPCRRLLLPRRHLLRLLPA
jgi:hypothetical protein